MTIEQQIMNIASQYAINETDCQNGGKAASKRGLLLSAFRDGARNMDLKQENDMNYYIQGCAAKADQIKAAFEKLGYNTGNLGFTSGQLYYTVEGKVKLMCTKSLQNLIKTHPDYKELGLPKPHYDIANFHAGMPVLVRDYDNSRWSYVQFSHYVGECGMKFNACGIPYIQCIPYEGNETLLGTTDMCNERFINW